MYLKYPWKYKKNSNYLKNLNERERERERERESERERLLIVLNKPISLRIQMLAIHCCIRKTFIREAERTIFACQVMVRVSESETWLA